MLFNAVSPDNDSNSQCAHDTNAFKARYLMVSIQLLEWIGGSKIFCTYLMCLHEQAFHC